MALKKTEATELPNIPPEALQRPPLNGGGRGAHAPPIFGAGDDAAIIPEDFSVAKEMMSPGETSGELDVRSDINSLQMVHMARGRFEARRFRSKALDAFINDFLRLSVSLGRKGRKEVVQIQQSANMGDSEAATGVWARAMRNMRE